MIHQFFSQDELEFPGDDLNFNIRLLAEAQNVAHIGIWQWKMGENVKWSKELYRIYGLARSEYQPTFEGYLKKIHPDDCQKVASILQKALAEKSSFSQDEKVLRPDGTIRHLHTWGHPVVDNDGNLERFIGVCQDITERVRAEEELRKSEERYRNIVEAAQDGIWLLDDQAVTVFANERLAEILNCSVAEVLGKPFSAFVGNAHKNLAAQLLAQTKARQFRFPLKRKDGARAWTTMATSPLHDDKSRHVGSIAIVTDQTRTIEHEILLSAQRDMFDTLNCGGTIHQALTILVRAIESILEGVIGSVLLLDPEGKRILTGAAPGLPESYCSAIHGQPIGPNAGSCGTAAFIRKMVVVEDIQNDARWVNYRALANSHGLCACWSNPIFDNNGKVLGTFAMYFKEVRRPIESEIALVLEATSAAALAIEHVQMRGVICHVEQKEREVAVHLKKSVQLREDFIALASHELRTPLTPLAIQMELIRLRLASLEVAESEKMIELQRLVMQAGKQVAKLSEVAEDLLNVSQINAEAIVLQPKHLNLADVVQKTIEGLDEAFLDAGCSKVVAVKCDAHGFWDPAQIERAIHYIMANAIKFGAGQPVEIEVCKDNKFGICTVKDHGIGISKKDQAKLFQRFQRIVSLRRYGGMGIGLYVANEIIKAHQGRIDVQSQFGKGSCFVIRLPVESLN